MFIELNCAELLNSHTVFLWFCKLNTQEKRLWLSLSTSVIPQHIPSKAERTSQKEIVFSLQCCIILVSYLHASGNKICICIKMSDNGILKSNWMKQQVWSAEGSVSNTRCMMMSWSETWTAAVPKHPLSLSHREAPGSPMTSGIQKYVRNM